MANFSPIFVLTPNCPVITIPGLVASANTARDGSGTLGTNIFNLFTAGANGSRVDYIKFTSAQATAAAMSSIIVGRVFLTDTTGANPRLIEEVAIANATASNTVIGATSTITFIGGLIIDSGQIIRVSQSVCAGVQDQMQVVARGGDY
jgi:hypothetical protein